MKSTRQILTLALVSTAAIAGGISSFVRYSSGEPTLSEPDLSEPDVFEEFIKTGGDRSQRFERVRLVRDLYRSEGMEDGRAGFHLLSPPWSGRSLASSRNITSFHAWWPLGVFGVDINGGYSIEWVSYARVIGQLSVSGASVNASPSGQFEVVAKFKQSVIDDLDRMVSPDPVSVYTDWYGIVRGAGEPPTEAFIVLVSDDIGYQPIAVSDVVGLGVSGEFVVASLGTLMEANVIVERLGF